MSFRYMLLSMMVSIAAGCATPYGNRLAIDYDQAEIQGSIIVSDAKLYRREALINERRREVQYIDRLMAKSEEDGFSITPEIVREIEVIRVLAASVGLSFDPAAGRSYRNSSETTEIQHDINVLQLQLQLDQLRRDAAIFRERLAAQIDPSRNDLGQPSAPSSGGAPPTLTPEDTKGLIDRIDAMQSALAGRFNAEVGKPRGVDLGGNPIDQFRDRAAYRQLLATARNAASLDELHDMDGAALYRLSFQVTTLPPAKSHRRTVGMVTMHPVIGKPKPEEITEIYSRWLDHLNQVLNGSDGADSAQVELGLLAANGLIDVIELAYDDESGAAKGADKKAVARPSKGKPAGKAAIPPYASVRCDGFESYGSTPRECGKLMLAMPNLSTSSLSFSGEERSMGTVVALDLERLFGSLYNQRAAELTQPHIAKSLIQVDGDVCELKPAHVRSALHKTQGLHISVAADAAQADTLASASVSVLAAMPFLTKALRAAASSSTSESRFSALNKAQTRLYEAGARARTFLESLAVNGCGRGRALGLSDEHIVVPDNFRKLVSDAGKIRVYEVGPREQVQQVSTAARAAEAFSLAMSMAAKAPSSGGAAKAGAGYSRSAMGKVDAVERLPVVIGFAQAENMGNIAGAQRKEPAFGWILGPRINLIDAKKNEMVLEQIQKPYDLSADLAVSGWRTRLTLEVRTVWSPDWRSPGFVRTAGDAGKPHIVTISLRPSSDEFSALTTQLAAGVSGGGQRFASIRRIRPGNVRACTAATLVIEGENLWRATEVVIGGQRIGGSALAVLPDMGGITVDIAANTGFPDPTAHIQILTPYGVVRSRQPLAIENHTAAGCKPQTKADGPAVTTTGTDTVNICSTAEITLYGQELEKITEAYLGEAMGTLHSAKPKAERRRVTFTQEAMAQLGKESELLTLLVDGKVIASKSIRIVRNCGKNGG